MDQKGDDDAQGLLCQEQKEEEDTLALKIAWLNQHENSKTTLKKKQRKDNL